MAQTDAWIKLCWNEWSITHNSVFNDYPLLSNTFNQCIEDPPPLAGSPPPPHTHKGEAGGGKVARTCSGQTKKHGPAELFLVLAIPSNLLILNGPQDCSTKRRKRRRFLGENLSHAHLSVSLVLLIHGYLACLLALSLCVFRDCVAPAHSARGACMCVRVCTGAQDRVCAMI